MRNGCVVEFNKAISALIHCNNAVILFGSSIQSKTALLYLLSYVANNNIVINQNKFILLSVKKDIDTMWSKVNSSKTNVRTMQHRLTQTLNKMDIMSELHNTQMVAALF